MPDGLDQLTQLQRLVLFRNQLTALPDSLGQLTRLQSLYLSDNQLTALPDSLGQLTRLESLYLDDNQLTALPDSLGQLSRLQSLGLDDNRLAVLPDWLGQLSQLQDLRLSDNQLTALQDWLGQLSQLEILYLSGNQLTALPDSLGQLTRLQRLGLDGNQLTALPDSLGQLSHLRYLRVSGNQLTALPDSLGQFTQLEILYLSDNQLTALPDSLRNLASLSQLFLHGNGALGLPLEVLGPTVEEIFGSSPQASPAAPSKILEYYFRVRVSKRPLNEAKLILVGRGGVGKTSLVNRLLYNRFDEGEKKTEGINITDWSLRLNNDEDVRLNIWDFGSQEIMHATHQFFLTHRSLYLLVLNGREGGEDADADYWLRLIDSFGAESPVIVVLNKIKEHPFDLNRSELKQKFPAVRDFIRTDCEDGTGIKDLRKAIERETDRLEHLRDPFPSSWFQIKDQLARMEENYLSFPEFRKVCAQHQEEDEAAQDALAGYLHSLGIALNYKDDPRLQDTHVLNPRWVTNGIYKILNSERLEKQKGEIRLGDLSGILDSNEYPPNMRRFLFDLMRKFDLCFIFPHDDTHYLIPELLDKQQPQEAEGFKIKDCLNFQYHYPVLPEGLLPRFIVRTHVLSAGLRRWRTGVILQFDGCRALVKADVQDKKVFIPVSGPAANRRRLLAVIRSHFEEIHQSVRRLQPEEMVPLPDHPDMAVPYKKLVVMEQKGVGSFTEVVGSDVIELNVQELLNGVDLEGTRAKEKRPEARTSAVRLFYSYSHKDEMLRNELRNPLEAPSSSGVDSALA